ncbi:isoprenoid synthase domain-containing protein [Aspergillus crustosus]
MESVVQDMRHCKPIDYNNYDPLPTDHICTYPVFSSEAGPVATEASAQFTADWKRACEADGLHQGKLDFQACTTHLGHYFQWAYPDCLPERVALGAVLSDCAFFWDDVTDSISTELNAELTQDFGIAMLSELQAGKRIEPKFEINKIAVQVARDLIAVDPYTGIGHLKGWKGHLDAQEKSTHNNMSWQQYVEHRVAESGGGWGISFGCWTNDIRITDEEKMSVKYLTQLACAGGILGNDYFSFNKEFDEHHRSGTLDRIQNSVALFMREYGYTEKEALGILKEEVQRREKEFMDGFDAWSRHAGPEAAEVRRYLVMTMALMSGSMFWMSFAGRYHRTDLTTTAEDRAGLIGKSHGALRVLEGYPPPRSTVHESLPQQNGEANGETNGEADGQDMLKENSVSNGVHPVKTTVLPATSTDPYTAPFQEAPGDASPSSVLFSICDAPYDYINSLPSKKARNKLLDALNHWLQVPRSSVQRIKNIIHMLHNSSLMLDDIEDSSALRRGQPATHSFYGISQTINSANFVYVKAVGEVGKLYNPGCMDIFIDELSNLHRGQSLDLHWRHHARCPTTEEYIIMVDNKTGGLFRLMLRLMAAESLISLPLDTALLRLLTLTGRYYQIRDDYLNLTSADYTTKKGFCEDFDEGKFSLPLIHLLQNTPHPDRITSVIYNRTPGTKLAPEVKEHILAAMEAARTLEHTRGVLKHLHIELMKTLDETEERLGVNDRARLLLLGLGLGLHSY